MSVSSNKKRKARLILEAQKTWKIGDVVRARVIHLSATGVLLTSGQVRLIMPPSEVDHAYTSDPSDALTKNQWVEVKVIRMQQDRPAIIVSRKALMPDPWRTYGDRHYEGETVLARVYHYDANIGYFARLPDGISGLIYESDLLPLTIGDTLKLDITHWNPIEFRCGFRVREDS